MYLICLHNVIREKPDTFDKKCSRIDEAEFSEFLEKTKQKFHLISFSTYLEMLKQNKPDPKAVALSFDDGFLGVHKYAAPILKKQGIDAALFLSPLYLGIPKSKIFHFLEIEIMFRLAKTPKISFDGKEYPLKNDEEKVKAMKAVKRKLKAISDAERSKLHAEILGSLGVSMDEILNVAKKSEKFFLVDESQISSLEEDGWTIAPHTLSHRSLAWLPENEMRDEIEGSKLRLEKLLGHKTEIFAYPYGESIHVGEHAPRICSELGIEFSFTTEVGSNMTVTDPQRLLRYDYKDFVRTKLS